MCGGGIRGAGASTITEWAAGEAVAGEGSEAGEGAVDTSAITSLLVYMES